MTLKRARTPDRTRGIRSEPGQVRRHHDDVYGRDEDDRDREPQQPRVGIEQAMSPTKPTRARS